MKILYVMGSGRSGSTLLDILMGSHPDVVSTGELSHLVRSGWSNAEICACGTWVTECLFWSAVRERWIGDIGVDGSEEYVRLQNWMERLRRMPALVKPAWVHPSERRYCVLTKALVQAIATTSVRTVVVDSSKSPVRALALSRLKEVQLFALHLVRDCRAVAWSFGKRFEKDPRAGIQGDQHGIPTWRSAVDWDFVNLQSEWVRSQIPSANSIRVHYEDLVRDPRTTFQRIGALVGIDFSGVAERVVNGIPVEVGHPVAGNRLRMDRVLRISSDESWRTLMPARDQRLVRAIAWPFMEHYRYR